ncbi:MAG TPA: elongation factor P hydroxylase [Stellaceae bacterium]|nr:elongation factor P hydroxylase [Stellaceae bacterium]
MILTPIPRTALPAALDRFAMGLHDRAAASAFARIRATAPDRAVGAAAEAHRLAALAFAAGFGVAVHPPGTECRYNWDGAALDGSSEAYVILHEVAHFVLAPAERRTRVDFGLGPGPDTRDRETARRAAILSLLEREEDEALASLLGILWEVELGQPALASFLDQNWLEGLDRSAAPHFTAVLAGLARRGLVDARARPVIPPAARRPARSDRGTADRDRRGDRASAAGRGCLPDPAEGGRGPAGPRRRSG